MHRSRQAHRSHEAHRSRRAATIAVGAALLLAGCASTPRQPPAPVADANPAAPLSLAGRFAMTYTQSVPEAKQESASGRFTLHRDPKQLAVDLFSPFGQTIARAEQNTGQPARLVTADNRTLTGATLDEVFQRAIGIRVPAEKLPDWLSNRFERTLSRSPDGQRIRATDAGWDIDRDENRWNLVWHQGSQRIEVRLVVDGQ